MSYSTQQLALTGCVEPISRRWWRGHLADTWRQLTIVQPDGRRLRHAPVHVVRAVIADAMLASDDAAPELGTITLWDHQREAIVRLRAAIREFGGALLADEVGLGKTYVALALAAGYSSPLVVAPAALRSSWARAFTATSLPLAWISIESLSFGLPEAVQPDFVVVDEAHHARNPATRRYRALSELTGNAHVLLLSATPIHNARRDLIALLALFLSQHAQAIDDTGLARLVVRRTQQVLRSDASLPSVAPTVAIPTDDDFAVVKRILALPSPVSPEDGGSADALVAFTLVRQWASSTNALRSALRRRIGRTRALMDTLRSGRLPSCAEVDAWVVGDDAQQLAFAELLAPASGLLHDTAPTVTGLLRSAEQHEQALVALAESLGDGPDVARASALQSVLAAHPGEKVLAFSQFYDTVSAYWRLMRGVPGVCALSASGARVAGGRLSRSEAIERFAPRASGVRPVSAAEDIRLLLTTDILSEGVNLQDASVVVHLDLPWTAARIEQRVGRIARAGSPHRFVSVYSLDPPASSEEVIAIERRLHEKIAAASRAVGAPSSLVGLHNAGLTDSPPAASERLRSTMRRWARAGETQRALVEGISCAVVSTHECGWIALLRAGKGFRIVAALGNRIGTDATIVNDVVALIDDATVDHVVPEDMGSAVDAIEVLLRWRRAERASVLAGVPDISAVRHRRAAFARLANLESLPRVKRVALQGWASEARRLATGRLSAGRTRSVSAAGAMADPDAWLRRMAELSRSGHEGDSILRPADEELVALLVLVRYPG